VGTGADLVNRGDRSRESLQYQGRSGFRSTVASFRPPGVNYVGGRAYLIVAMHDVDPRN